MRFLYITTVFPEEGQNDTIYTDFAECLRDHGHDVTVAVADGSSKHKTTCLQYERGMRVLRIKTSQYYNVSFVQKGIAAIRLPFQVRRAIRKYLWKESFDSILFESPPITLSNTVAYSMKRFQCPSYLMMKDIFPQNAIDLRILSKRSPIYWWFVSQEKRLYKTATWIGCMSQANLSYIKNHNPSIPQEKLVILPNTKKAKLDRRKHGSMQIRRDYRIPDEAVVAVIGGNMGKPQGLDFILDTACSLRNRKDIFFLFIGRGSERNNM